MNRRQFHRSTAGCLAAGWMSLTSAADDEPQRTLAQHRIASLAMRTVNLEWPRMVGRNAVKGVHGNGPHSLIVILKTDQGAQGWGLVRGDRRSVEQIEERVLGQRVSGLIAPSIGILEDFVSPLDFALHDLAGVILERPVWRMIAPDSRTEPHLAPIYSGMIYFDDLDPPEAPAGIGKLIEECRWDYDYGYRQFKLKVGRGNKWMPPRATGLQRDIDAVRAVAAAFPDCEILVDANNGFTLDECLTFLQELQGIELFWIEEPFHETVEDYRRLHTWMQEHGVTNTYLADGEAQPDTPVLEELQREQILDVRLEDVAGLGFTPWRRLLSDLVRQKLLASPHTWGSGLKTVYAAHLGGGLGGLPTVEGVTCSPADVDFGEHVIRDGNLQLSSKPGFGLALKS
ncbi:MAG: hypothetical protein KDA75_00085 [Planctomycetaceae bacterium]|nr:hypothetical protein [Planctomycetaceae bacterium]